MASPNYLGIPTSYTIKSGDTLSKISLSLYGSTSFYNDLARLNNIADPSKISVGQKIQVYPAMQSATTAVPVQAIPKQSPVIPQTPANIVSTASTTKTPIVASSVSPKSVIKNIITDPKVLIASALAVVAGIVFLSPKSATRLIKPSVNPEFKFKD